MAETRFCSFVFVLTPDSSKRITTERKFMGRAAQSLALDLIGQIDPELSKRLHPEGNEPKSATTPRKRSEKAPYTVSNLFQSDSLHHWMRISSLHNDVSDALVKLEDLWKKRTDAGSILRAENWKVVHVLSTQHDWCDRSTPSELINRYWKPVSQFELAFATPTAIKSEGLLRSLPETGILFKNLYERWRSLGLPPLEFEPTVEAFERFAHEKIKITDFQIQAVQVATKNGGEPNLGFEGTVRFRVEHLRLDKVLQAQDPEECLRMKNEHQQFVCLLHMLAHFSFYSGIGIKTAEGMGMVRPIDGER